MSYEPSERMFWFHGDAVAFGGQIAGPQFETLDAQAASVLPPIGGFASHSTGPYDHRGIVSFERATSTVSGRSTEHEGVTTRDTLVSVTVEGLNILDVLTADRVCARMTSTNPAQGLGSQMLPFGSYVENLRIGGQRIELDPYPDLVRLGGYADIASKCSDRVLDAKGNPVALDKRSKLRTEEWSPGSPSPVFEDRHLLLPLFDIGIEKGHAPPGCEVSGAHGIHVPGFGVVYFGEYLVSSFTRRLTMLRVELGCPVAGTLVVAYGGINGNDYP